MSNNANFDRNAKLYDDYVKSRVTRGSKKISFKTLGDKYGITATRAHQIFKDMELKAIRGLLK